MFRGELQAAARYRRKRPDFADDGEDAGSAQTLLHGPQDLGITRRSNQHDATGIKPVRGKTRPIEIRAGQAPQHHAFPCPAEDTCRKSGGERAILLVANGSEGFVQGAARKPAARQCPVDRRGAERQDSMHRRRPTLDPPDALTELRRRGVFCAEPGMFSRPKARDDFAQNPMALLVKIPLLQQVPWLRHSSSILTPCDCSLYVL